MMRSDSGLYDAHVFTEGDQLFILGEFQYFFHLVQALFNAA
jgi:hypothetical protein